MERGLIPNTVSRIQNLVFRLSFSLCNSVFVFSFCNYFGSSSSLQFLQFGICIQFLHLFRYFIKKIFVQFLQSLFSFCNLVFCFPLLLHSGSLWLLIMATERDDLLQSVSVRLDGKNYSYWSYVMRNFLKGKKMWGYVSGTYLIPKNIEEGDVVLIDT